MMNASLPAKPIKVVLVGFGQIGRSQHAPILRSRPSQFDLCAIVDPAFVANDDTPAPVYSTLLDALARDPDADAAVIACPPHYAQDYASDALDAGLSVFVEKPPGFDCKRLLWLWKIAQHKALTLYTGYHSAACPEIDRAKEWVQTNHPIKRIRIEWKESAKKWHPGQTWITDQFGVLDILFNPISMLEEILGASAMENFELEHSSIAVPSNWRGPIAGSTTLTGKDMCPIIADYGWNHEGKDIWKIFFESAAGRRMELRDGGAQILVDGIAAPRTNISADVLRPEYETLYDRFVHLWQAKESEVRITPLRIMNDILVKSERTAVDNYSI